MSDLIISSRCVGGDCTVESGLIGNIEGNEKPSTFVTEHSCANDGHYLGLMTVQLSNLTVFVLNNSIV